MTDDLTKYGDMQRGWYDNPAFADNLKEGIVGDWTWNEACPYETLLLYRRGDIRRPLFEKTKDKLAFDVCCGEGRMARRMNKLFKRCDGADISKQMIAAAKAQTPESNFWVTSGMDCGDAPSNTYDFVFCTISLQHIAVYNVRRAIIEHARRIMKPGGKITLQMSYSEHFPYRRYVGIGDFLKDTPSERTLILPRDWQHASYFENKTDATMTNGGCDVVIGEADLPAVQKDFGTLFDDIDIWFHAVGVARRTQALGLFHSNCTGSEDYWCSHHIYIHGTKPLS